MFLDKKAINVQFKKKFVVFFLIKHETLLTIYCELDVGCLVTEDLQN